MRFNIFVLCTVAICLGCKSTERLSKIEESDTIFIMPELKSTLNLHFELSKQALQDTFNTIIDQYLAGDMELSALGMDIVLQKQEPALMEISGRQVLSKLPIKIGVHKKTFINNISAQGVLVLNFKTDVDIDTSWNLVTRTTLEHYEWTEKPALSLGVFSIPVAKLANGIIEKSKLEFENQIDKSVNEQLSVRDKVLDLLKYVEEPIELDTVLNSWITIIPEHVHLSEILNYRNWFNGNVTIQGRSKISENKPEDHVAGIKLPKFSWHEELDDTSHINFVFDLSYSTISEYLNNNYQGRTFAQDGKHLTVNHIALHRKGVMLISELEVSGTVNGLLSISGKPIFDNERQIFFVDELDIDLKTKNVLHKAGAWFMKGRIKNQLKELMTFSIEENLEAIQQQLNKEVLKYSRPKQLSLQADIKKLNVNKFVLGDDKIHSFVTLNLFLKAVIHDMRLFNNTPTQRNFID